MKNLLLGAALLLALPVHAADKHAAGSVFSDCKECPNMVVLPAGTFTMGTQDEEIGRQPDEGPLHPVTFAKSFAISRFQVSAGEWDAYVQQAKVTIANGDERPGRECVASKPRYPQGPTQPAVCMSYDDVKGYVAWLSKKTGKHYRMLSEAEREYAARAGTPGPFPFPFDEGADYSIAKHANTYGPVDGFSFTSPGGSYPPNAFGVYDLHGNVYEWVADCMHDSYNGAPGDGSAWMETSCEYHMIRGNDYTEAPIFSRSGNRNYREPYVRGDWLGFRVARDL